MSLNLVARHAAALPAARSGGVRVPSTAFAVLVVFGTIYNGLLAIANAHGVTMSYGLVAVTEIALLAVTLGLIAVGGFTAKDGPPIGLALVFLVLALTMSIGFDFVWIKMFRSVLLIAVFTMAGMRTERRELIRLLCFLSVLVLAVLVLEMVSVSTYVAIFQPSLYLENSRGAQAFELNDTGLFANALGFEGRFSFGIFNGPRTSSIFLEQVSLAGYASVLTVCLLALWRHLPRWHRLLHVGLILLILLSNNSRTSSLLLLPSLFGYWLYPRLPGRLTLLLAPVFIGGAALFVVLSGVKGFPDDIGGRLNLTVSALGQLDLWTLFLGSPGLAEHSADSGYPYIIGASTLVGLVVYWLFCCTVVPDNTIDRRRTLWALCIYLFSWLLIGGTATFTIKTAALLWLVVGHMRRDGEDAVPLAAATSPARLTHPSATPRWTRGA